jgi:DNA repair ATPase RecN
MIKSLTLRNFKTHADTKLEFVGPGINVITGDSGCGKTNTLLGIQLVTDNRPLGANWIRRGQDSGAVAMEVSEDEDVYKVTRKRGPSENKYILENNGVELDPFTGFGDRPPSMVSDVLNLSDLNVQKQRDQHFLVYTPPGQIATYIRSITKLDEIDRVTKLLSSKIRTEKSEVVSREKELKTTKEKLTALGAIDLHSLESKIKEAKIHIAEVIRLKAEVEQLNTIVNDLRALEKRQIHIPDNIDQILDKAKQSSENIVAVTTNITNLKSLIGSIKRIETNVIVLPENLEVLSTVEGTLEQYNNIDTKLEVLVHLIDDIQIVESEIATSTKQLEQLELEELQLKEKLETCPSCGSMLTKESKQILLGK